MKGDLTHENKQGDHGQTVRSEDVEQILGHEIERGVHCYQVGKTDNPQKGHQKADRHLGKNQDEQ